MRRLVLALLILAVVPASIAATAIAGDDLPSPSTTTQTETTRTIEAAPPSMAPLVRRPAVSERTLVRQIEQFKRTTWRWQRLMGVRLTTTAGRNLADASYGTLVAVRNKWRRFAARAHRQAAHPPHYGAWLCIHRYEASWTDAGAPYYGGLQMDWSFMASYGGELLRRKGPAGNWTPLEQMWVAERAYHSGRGFYAWPNTARYCGLI
jgi:hypothetical protein